MTMTSDFDIVIIGAGHNGLIAGAYLTALGQKVCLVETHSKVGGGVITDEVTLPGFKHDLCATVHHTIRESPLIKDDDLGLQRKYGLKYIVPEVQRVILFPGGRKVVMHKDIQVTCDYIGQWSAHDAAEYPRFIQWARDVWQLSGTLMGPLHEPSPAIVESLRRRRRGGRLARTARRWTDLLRLSGPMLKYSPHDLFRMATTKATDIYEMFFENEFVKAMLYKHCTQPCVLPYRPGTAGIAALVAIHDHSASGGIPEGGSGVLCEVLARYVQDHGGTILVNSEATKVIVRNQEAKGVVLRDGTELSASKAVISNINIKQLFLQLVDPTLLGPSLVGRIKMLRHSPLPSISVHAATWQPPIFDGHPDIQKPMSVEIIPYDSPLESLLNHFSTIEGGVMPMEPSVWVDTHTLNDPTRAPAGGHTVWVYGPAPYSLKEGGPSAWQSFGEVAAKRMWNVLTRFASNMRWDDIAGYYLETPLAYAERNPAMIFGDHEHLAMEVDQMYFNRPLPELSDFTTPIRGLYLCGASISGGPVTGAGRAAAIAAAVDLGLVDNVSDFEQAARKASA